jgi:DHA2 family multidrug resistance protein
MGIISIQPIMCENLMNYSTSTTGLIMAPRGFASAIAMAVTGRLLNRYDPRHLIALGIFCSAMGSWQMSHFTLNTSLSFMMWAGVIQGLGMGFFFVPLSVLAFSTLASNEIAEAAGLFSFGRNLGSSIGISLLSTLLTRESQINWNQLGGHINIFNSNLQLWLHHQGWSLNNPLAIQQLAVQLANQSSMIAFLDAYWAIAVGFMFLVPLVYVMRKPKKLVGLDALGH